MRRSLLLPLALAGICAASSARAQDSPKVQSQTQGPLSGRWIITADYLGTPLNVTLELTQQADKLTGNFEGDKLEGTVSGSSIHFLAKDEQGGSEETTATVQGDSMSGTVIGSMAPIRLIR